MRQIVTAKIEMGAQTYKLLAESAGSIFGDTAEDVALYLILRGLQDLVKDGLLQWREGQLKLATRKSVEPRKPVRDSAQGCAADSRLWCEQCEKLVAPATAQGCASRFCKAKALAA